MTSSADTLDIFAELPVQLVLIPEPPDTAAMTLATKAKLSFWLGVLNEEYAADRISQCEWLLAREQVWDRDSKECMRQDQMYCDYHTTQAMGYLREVFGEEVAQHLVNLLSSKTGGGKAHAAAVRVAAKRTQRGADYAELVQYAQGLPTLTGTEFIAS